MSIFGQGIHGNTFVFILNMANKSLDRIVFDTDLAGIFTYCDIGHSAYHAV